MNDDVDMNDVEGTDT